MAAKKTSLDIDVMDNPAPAAPAISEDAVSKRIAEMRAKRQNRESRDVSDLTLRLGVPEHLKDKRLMYRWVLDRDMRNAQMQAKDWFHVQDSEIAQAGANTSLGTTTERIVNERGVAGGGVEKAFLMAKPVEFYEQDKKAEQDRLKDLEKGLSRGDVNDPSGLSGPNSYIPSGGMKIEIEK